MNKFIGIVAATLFGFSVQARPLGPQPEREFEGKIGFSATADTLLSCHGRACEGADDLGGLGDVFGGLGGQNCEGLSGSTVILDDLPETETLRIVHARLNWAATIPSMAESDDTVTLIPPEGERIEVLADPELSESFEDGTDAATCMFLRRQCGQETVCAMKHYSNWADVTGPLQRHLASGGRLNGEWTLSDVVVPGSDGDDPMRAAAAFASNTIGAWSLIIVYSDPVNLPTRRLYFYRGLELISGTDITLTPSGFTAPPNPEADIALMVLEGDANIVGDGVSVNLARLSDACNPAQNMFNSTVNTGRSDGQCRMDVTGVDLDRFTVPNAIDEGDESAQVSLSFSAGGIPGLTPTEQLFTNWMVVVFDHLLPNFDAVKPEKEADPPHGSTVNPGDPIQYMIKVTNRGEVAATNVLLRDAVPRGTTYVPGSAQLDAQPFADDNGMRLPLEDGVQLTDLSIVGNEIEVGESHIFEFVVTVNADAPDGFEITNIAYIEADLVGELRTEPVRHTVRIVDESASDVAEAEPANLAEADAAIPEGASSFAMGGTNAVTSSAQHRDAGLVPVKGGEVAGHSMAAGAPHINMAPDLSAQCGEGTRLDENGVCIATDSGSEGGCACHVNHRSNSVDVSVLMCLFGLFCRRRRGSNTNRR
ncbi:MAG: hypothetical protein VX589_11405 [Myxococcota bacterium]|nr:hypothetical protein [Myxococcota bacterium]